MKKRKSTSISTFVVQKRNLITTLFLTLTILCGICFPFVGVNYDLSKYLPDFAPTKQALDVMEETFGYPGMARVMVRDVTREEAKHLRDQISQVEGVDLVVGADLIDNIYLGRDFLSPDLAEDFYKDGNALYEIVFTEGDSDKLTHQAIDEISALVGGEERAAFSGSAVSSKFREEAITREIMVAIVLAVVIILAILLLTTNSWFEPFLFITVMAVAILMNMGSNIIFGSISFFTFSTAAILQLAVSMDYSIFLLHTFMAFEKQGYEAEEAMIRAIDESSSSIFASGLTTIVGFLAIALMQFTVGRDVGFVLTKGIICSLAAVMLLMPALILRFNGLIKKTAHKPLIPEFKRIGVGVQKVRWPVLVICLLLAVPCYFGQGLNKFYYGDNALGASPGTTFYDDTEEINGVFGKSSVVIAIVPDESIGQERALTEALDDLPFTNYALSLGGVLPNEIPVSFLPEDVVELLHTDGYARLLISMNTVEESDYAFECSQKLSEVVGEYYPEESYVIGMTPTTIDIRDILTEDYNRVSIISLIGVFLVVLGTFRSVLIPLFVVIPIEIAIYFNMTIPYLVGDSLIYIGYIIVSCLQLGATIDYSILTTNNYLDERKHYDRKEAAIRTVNRSAASVLTSGLILTVVGYLLYFTSTIVAIKQVGHMVGRGAILSVILVLSLLPALLSAFDSVIQKEMARAEARAARRRARLRRDKGEPEALPDGEPTEIAPPASAPLPPAEELPAEPDLAPLPEPAPEPAPASAQQPLQKEEN